MKVLNNIKMILLLVVLCFNLSFSQEDLDKIRSLIQMKPSKEKVTELHKFQIENPKSQYFNRATQEIFNVYLSLNEVDSALQYAHKYIQALPEQNKNNAYNGIAYALAEKEIGLDTALIYSSRAVEATLNNPRLHKIFLDTQAYVLFKKGDARSALDIQTDAIKGNENDPEYVYHLALYQHGNGKVEDALRSAAWATLKGDPGNALDKFNQWSEGFDSAKKEKIAMDAIQAYLDSSAAEDQAILKSNAAAFMGQTGINLNKAREWANSAVRSIDEKTSVENYINFNKNMAIIEAAEKKYEKAKVHLEEVKNLVDPWTSNYWLTLGKTYENLSDKEKALDAYVSGLIAFNNPQIMEAALKISSEEQIQNKIEKMKEELSSVEAGEFKAATKTTEKVVLAELFTGAECPPCVAADNAFDKLAEYYPRNAVAILEYHLHIPGPDPMTNPNVWKRYSWYGGDFGTPTVFFEGTEQIVGGGPGYVVANRFNVYNYAIKKFINEQPEVTISGSAKRQGSKVDIKISVKQNNPDVRVKNPMLHIALTEKQVDYTGGNGVSKHIFVVRDLIEGTEGSRVYLNEGADVYRIVDVAEIEKILKEYLDDPTKDQSWRPQLQFTGWRARTDEINEENLAIVAWIQDADTKEVLQSYYFDVN